MDVQLDEETVTKTGHARTQNQTTAPYWSGGNLVDKKNYLDIKIIIESQQLSANN